MVGVKMRGKEIINPPQAGDVRRDVMNASGIASARITGINQHGFTRWRDNECRAASFRIDPVDIERFIRRARLRRSKSANCESDCEYADKAFHDR